MYKVGREGGRGEGYEPITQDVETNLRAAIVQCFLLLKVLDSVIIISRFLIGSLRCVFRGLLRLSFTLPLLLLGSRQFFQFSSLCT